LAASVLTEVLLAAVEAVVVLDLVEQEVADRILIRIDVIMDQFVVHVPKYVVDMDVLTVLHVAVDINQETGVLKVD